MSKNLTMCVRTRFSRDHRSIWQWLLAGAALMLFSAVPVFGATAGAEYLIIDLSGGASAAAYPHATQVGAPADLLTNTAGVGGNSIYKTSKLVLRRIPAGTFTMGSPSSEAGHVVGVGNEGPQHQVTLTKDFYISVFEVTQEQYRLGTGKTPSYFPGKPAFPVERVNWNVARGGKWPGGVPGADTFIGLIRAKTGMMADLPTEAQWEYACRAGTTAALSNGTELTSPHAEDAKADAVAWYRGNHKTNGETAGPKEVGRKPANPWGLYDMHGNVFEWCLDWMGNYPSGAVTDPEGPSSGMYVVARSGSWNYAAYMVRSAYRNYDYPGFGEKFSYGIRLVIPHGAVNAAAVSSGSRSK